MNVEGRECVYLILEVARPFCERLHENGPLMQATWRACNPLIIFHMVGLLSELVVVYIYPPPNCILFSLCTLYLRFFDIPINY